MKLRTIGRKLSQFTDTLGKKLHTGAKLLGNKIYDNRYKILATAGAIGLGVALPNSTDIIAKVHNTAQHLTPQFVKDATPNSPARIPPLSERLKAHNPNVFVPIHQRG